MRFPPAPPTFTRRETVLGQIVGTKTRTPTLDCLIDLSETGSHGIIGWVLGNAQTVNQIEKVLHESGPLRFEGSDGGCHIVSERLWINGFTTYGGGATADLVEGLTGVVCRFEISELSSRFDLRSDTTPKTREVRFLLSGPDDKWYWWGTRSRSYTGEANAVEQRRVSVGAPLLFSIWTVRHYFHSTESPRDESPYGSSPVKPESSEISVMALSCRTTRTALQYSDAAFLAEATRAVEDLSLITSFLSDSQIVWYCYTQGTADQVITFRRQVWQQPTEDSRSNYQLIVPHDVRPFVARAFRKLRALRSRGINLEVPILYTLTANRTPLTRQRFAELFLALEALRSTYLESVGRSFVVGASKFAKVQSAIKSALPGTLQQHGIKSRTVLRQMLEKVPELRRPPFWDGLSLLMRYLRVPWQDLYPQPVPDKPTFLGLRNSLFHSHGSHDDENLLKEKIRLEYVVKRIILRWLGQEDLWHAPLTDIRGFIAGTGWPHDETVSLINGRTRRGVSRKK